MSVLFPADSTVWAALFHVHVVYNLLGWVEDFSGRVDFDFDTYYSDAVHSAPVLPPYEGNPGWVGYNTDPSWLFMVGILEDFSLHVPPGVGWKIIVYAGPSMGWTELGQVVPDLNPVGFYQTIDPLWGLQSQLTVS